MSPLRPCGTLAAYKRHRRNGEEPCALCRGALACYGRLKYLEQREQRISYARAHRLTKPRSRSSVSRAEDYRRRNPEAIKYRGETRLCDYCREPFLAERSTARFCGGSCRTSWHRSKAPRPPCRKCGANSPLTPHRTCAGCAGYSESERRTRLRNGDVRTVIERDLRRMRHRLRGLCAYCRERPAETLDHVIPVRRGGRHSIGNLLLACSSCNPSKGARLLADWRMSRNVFGP